MPFSAVTYYYFYFFFTIILYKYYQVNVILTISYLSNRPHFLLVYRRDNPRGMLGEREKSL